MRVQTILYRRIYRSVLRLTALRLYICLLGDKRIIFIGNLSDQEIEGRINDFPLNVSKTLLESEEAVKLCENGYIIPPYGYMVAEM